MYGINGLYTLRALGMLGHHVDIRTMDDPGPHARVVGLRYHPPGDTRWRQIDITVAEDQLMAADAADQMMAVIVEKALRELLSEQVLLQAALVLDALRRGSLPAELIGGPRDGEVLGGGLQIDRDGWPMPRIYIPLPVPVLPSLTVVDVLAPTVSGLTTAVYEREWVSPDTLHWRYLFVPSH